MLVCPQADTLCAKVKRTGWIGNPFEDIVFLHNLGLFKSGSAHGAEKLCPRQASRNSTRPQGDIIHCRFGDRL